MSGSRKYKCLDCKHQWHLPFGPILPGNCPKCSSKNLKRVDEAEEHRKKPVGRSQASRSGSSLGGRGSGVRSNDEDE
jgi:hypothetical protein